jgi:pyruvate kinase
METVHVENARTQIVATVGPASSTAAIMTRLVDAGVDVFRVNLSHGDTDSHRRLIRLAHHTGVKVMVDLPGPKIRVQSATEPLPMKLAAGEKVSLASSMDSLLPGMKGLLLPQGIAYSRASKDTRILVDDGNMEFVVKQVNPDSVVAENVVEGEVKPRKGVAFSEDLTDFPPLVDEDKKVIAELADEPFDMVAASFVKCADTISALREQLALHRHSAAVVAKIEDPSGVKNAEEIVKAADGIMVARGDLGVCMPLAALPVLQKRLVALANYYRKTVIVATQMLESMTEHPRPTRAEVTDVANAVFDGADAVMLSGETAVGKFPVETVETMAEIIENAENAWRTGLKMLL